MTVKKFAMFLSIAAWVAAPLCVLFAQTTQSRQSGPCTNAVTRSDFVGRWQAGQGNGASLTITLFEDGRAWKDTGPSGGNWEFVDGEAEITWKDGWHDVIAKRGSSSGYFKWGYEPGRSMDGTPSNVTQAMNIGPAK